MLPGRSKSDEVHCDSCLKALVCVTSLTALYPLPPGPFPAFSFSRLFLLTGAPFAGHLQCSGKGCPQLCVFYTRFPEACRVSPCLTHKMNTDSFQICAAQALGSLVQSAPERLNLLVSWALKKCVQDGASWLHI